MKTWASLLLALVIVTLSAVTADVGMAQPSARQCATEKARTGRIARGCPGYRAPQPRETRPDRERRTGTPARDRPRGSTPAVPPAPPPAPRTYHLVIQNDCGVPLDIRLVYRTPNGLENPPAPDDTWRIPAGPAGGPVQISEGRSLELASGEVYHHVTRADGTVMSFPGARPFTYNGRELIMARAATELDPRGGYYTITYCPGGSAPAAPSTAAAPAIPGPFIAYFEWDKDDISAEAALVLDEAAAAWQQSGDPTLQVTVAGHTDRELDDAYNLGMSQRRADNVRSYLAARGIPNGVIVTEAFGESRPRVETPDGVREPQNRRVEITFSRPGGP